MGKIFIGIDSSSQTIGIGIIELTDVGEIVYKDSFYLKPRGTDLFDKIYSIKDQVRSVLEKHKPTNIYIEDIIKFMAHRSTASTIISLTTFNRALCNLCHEYLLRENIMPHKPVILNVSRIRHTIKLQKGKAPKKEDIPAVLSKRLGVEVPIYFNKNNKKIIPMSEI